MVDKKEPTVFLKIPLFRDLPKLDLYRLIDELPTETYNGGDFVFREGEAGNSMYVVMTGELEVVLASDTHDEMHLRTCGPGEYVGEMSLIMPKGRRTAAVRATKPSRLWVMTREKFNE